MIADIDSQMDIETFNFRLALPNVMTAISSRLENGAMSLIIHLSSEEWHKLVRHMKEQ